MTVVFIGSLMDSIHCSVLDMQGQHVEGEALNNKKKNFISPNLTLKRGLLVHNDNCCKNSQL